MMNREWKDYYQRAVVERCKGKDAQASLDTLRNSLKEGHVALLIGAGVTAGLVGNWKDLLNELAIMRCGSQVWKCGDEEFGMPNLKQLRNYIKEVQDMSFLPVETSALEQSEYLKNDLADPVARLMREKGAEERWRERYFAAQVKDVINSLICERLRDAKGKMPKTLKQDFIDWCQNSADTSFFGIRRRDVSYNDVAMKVLNALKDASIITADDLADKLCERYDIDVDLAALRARAVAEGKSTCKIEDTVFEDLAAQASYALWRPGYGTLFQLLKLCVSGSVKEVITYNFDTVFDRLLIDSDIQRLLGAEIIRPVQIYGIHNEHPVKLSGADTDRQNTNAIRIFHVHGILDDELPVMPIIFSENSYQTYQSRVINPSSIRIAETVNAYDLLCVGFSGTDTNFRNLVQLCRQLQNDPIFASGRNEYLVYMTRSCKYDVLRYTKGRILSMPEEVECAYRCIDTYFDLVETYYKNQLGINVLWSEDFDDMAEQLNQLL